MNDPIPETVIRDIQKYSGVTNSTSIPPSEIPNRNALATRYDSFVVFRRSKPEDLFSTYQEGPARWAIDWQKCKVSTLPDNQLEILVPVNLIYYPPSQDIISTLQLRFVVENRPGYVSEFSLRPFFFYLEVLDGQASQPKYLLGFRKKPLPPDLAPH